MDAENNREARKKARRARSSRPVATSLLDSSLSALLLPLQRAASRPTRHELSPDAKDTANSSTDSFSEQPERLSINFAPLLDACSRMKKEAGLYSSNLKHIVRQFEHSCDGRPFTFPYPCISTNIEGIELSLRTVLDDLSRCGHSGSLTLNPSETSQERFIDGHKLRSCLSCDLCLHPLQNPHTCSICLHSFCRLCIEEALSCTIGEQTCPVLGCGKYGDQGFMPTLLRDTPLSGRHQCIVKDEILANLVFKVFGREATSREVPEGSLVPSFGPESAWMEDLGSVRQIQAKQSFSQPAVSIMQSQPAAEVQILQATPLEYLTVAVFERELDPAVYFLDDNYFHVPSILTPIQFSEHLEMRFCLNKIKLFCRHHLITTNELGGRPLGEIYHDLWLPFQCLYDEVFTLFLCVQDAL